jgi:hypothetical protein
VPELKLTVNCESMLISTRFFRFCKGLEHFYYTLLFTSEPYLNAGAGPWLSWLKIGFHVAEREPPSAAAFADRLRVDARPGKIFEVKASSSNASAMARLRELIGELDRVRRGLRAGDDSGRLQAIAADQKVDALLLAPLKSVLTRNAIPSDGADAFLSMIHRGLLALCDPQITSIEIGWN